MDEALIIHAIEEIIQQFKRLWVEIHENRRSEWNEAMISSFAMLKKQNKVQSSTSFHEFFSPFV